MKFLWRIAIRKGVATAVKTVLAVVGVATLQNWGISVNQAVFCSAVVGAIETLRNYLKVKHGFKL